MSTPQVPSTNAAEANTATNPTTLDPTLPVPHPIASIPLPQDPKTHLQIRPYHPLDAPRLALLANNPKIAAVMTNRFPHPYTLADAEWWIGQSGPGGGMSKAGAYFTVALKTQSRCGELKEGEDAERGLVIGGCGLDQGRDVYCRGAEMGYWLGEPYWGSGYASLMAGALVDWAFSQESGIVEGAERLLRIHAGVYGGNGASLRVLEKVGFRMEGCMKGAIWKYGVQRDLHNVAILREEWEAKKKA